LLLVYFLLFVSIVCLSCLSQLAAAASSAPRDAEPLVGPVRQYFIYLDVHCRGFANLAAAAVHLFPNNTIVP